MSDNLLHLIGYASGMAGAHFSVAEGPLALQRSPFLRQQDLPVYWEPTLFPQNSSLPLQVGVEQICLALANTVSELVKAKKRCCVVGGDHTSAIGTWSGVHDALKGGELGLIWIDAHMDSHTEETTETGRLHGMPLATLLGYGHAPLVSLLQPVAKIKPENLCLIGIRSFERGEAELLRRLKVRIYYMEEIQQRGFTTVLQEAVKIVSANTVGYGLSVDIDSVDPLEAPGVDVPAPHGIHAEDLYTGLAILAADPRLLATELVEFDPSQDKNNLTEKCVANCIQLLANGCRR